MKFKTKFHLTLVILITIANFIFAIPSVSKIENANASDVNKNTKLDKKKEDIYNKNISNVYNNINIKYISIKLYNNNISNSNKKKLSNSLSLKEQIEILMYSIKQVESSGRYKAKSKWSDACGAYQYMPITWNNYKGFKNACLAPEWAQDARMRGEVSGLWKKFHDWDKVIASHYLPAYANDKTKWNIHFYDNQPTVGQYVNNVKKRMNKIVVNLATT